MAKDTFQQIMLIGIGLMVAIGFSGVFTYSSLINTGGSNSNQGDQERNTTMPGQNYVEGSYDLSVREQAYLAVNNQVVFVNVLYDDNNDNYTQLQNIPSQFDDQVYINAINTSSSSFATGLGAEAPSALIIGDQPARTQRGTRPYSIQQSQIAQEAVVSGICDVKRDVSNFGATCYS